MDMQMYNAIRAAIADGKSVEDVIAEVTETAKDVKKELTPKFSIKKQYSRCIAHEHLCNCLGTIDKTALISVLGCYLVQSGFDPDVCFDNNDEFRKSIEETLDRYVKTFSIMGDIAKKVDSDAGDDEILATMFKGIGEMFKGAFEFPRL